MRLITLGLLLGSVPAMAQPASPADRPSCRVSVTLSGAPEEVRSIVDAWVRNEPSCGAALDVSIEGVADGYLVSARDARGALRVRLVPDVQTLGALIASWSADDRLALSSPGIGRISPIPIALISPIPNAPESPNRPVLRARALPTRRDPANGGEVTSDQGAPGSRDAAREVTSDHGESGSRDTEGSRRVLFGGLAGAEYGFRGEIDLFDSLLGLAIMGETEQSYVNFQALLYRGFDVDLSPWRLRGQLGAGLKLTPSHVLTEDSSFMPLTQSVVATRFAVATEASVTVSRELGEGWALTGGVLLSLALLDDLAAQTVVPVALFGLSRRL
jgi:hypothetical protein